MSSPDIKSSQDTKSGQDIESSQDKRQENEHKEDVDKPNESNFKQKALSKIKGLMNALFKRGKNIKNMVIKIVGRNENGQTMPGQEKSKHETKNTSDEVESTDEVDSKDEEYTTDGVKYNVVRIVPETRNGKMVLVYKANGTLVPNDEVLIVSKTIFNVVCCRIHIEEIDQWAIFIYHKKLKMV